MLKVLKSPFLVASVLFALMIGSLGAPVLAQCNNPNLTPEQAAQCGTNAAAGNSRPASQATNDLNSIIGRVINLLSIVGGILAVIMIIFAGYRYITSGGDATKVTSAKNTLVYAIIGLILAVLAQVIARFVLDRTT